MKEVVFIAKDKKKIFCTLWDKVKNPIGIVQIIHGMNEHVSRYDRFAKFLNKNGFIVFGDDHRAHGRTASAPDKIGTTDGNADLFKAIFFDELEIIEYLKNKYALPVCIFGHSYGSFITQALIDKTNLHSAVCLCGSAKFWKTYLFIARLLSWFGKTLFGKDHPANIIEFFSPIKQRSKDKSPLTRDKKQAEKYEHDKYFRPKFSYGFYYSMFDNLLKMKQERTSKSIPMLIISGEKDPVSMDAKLAKKLYKAYKKIGIKNIQFKLYANDRHELLNELNYKTVQSDILKFFKSSICYNHKNARRAS